MAVIVMEDDKVLRLLQLVLDPDTPRERVAAWVDYTAHDGDFLQLRDAVRASLPGLFPAQVRVVATPDELRAALPGADALVVEGVHFGAAELAVANQLLLVQKFGTLTANVDLAACERRGVVVKTLRRRTNIAVAEHALAMMFALARRLHRLAGKVSGRRLLEAGYAYRPYDSRNAGVNNYGRVGGLRMLHGTTLGILGMGEVGRELAPMAGALGMQVLYHQRHRVTDAVQAQLGIAYRTFDELCSESDILTVQVASGPATRGLVGRAALQRMKHGAWLINTARAELVERTALLEALASGQLGAAALDVHYEEPCADDDPLLDFENVILTPHFAGGPRTVLFDDIADVARSVQEVLQRTVLYR